MTRQDENIWRETPRTARAVKRARRARERTGFPWVGAILLAITIGLALWAMSKA